MIRDTAVDLIMSRLGKRVSTTLQQDVINEMVFVQENELEGMPDLPWMLVSEKTTAACTASDERMALPSDFLQEWEDGSLTRVDADGSETIMRRDDWDILENTSTLDGEGPPTYYDIAGDYILLRKTPDIIYNFDFRYYQRALSLAGTYGDANNIENKWLKWFSDLFIAKTGLKVASSIAADQAYARFAADERVAMQRYQAKITIMQETSKQRFMEG